MKILMCRTIQFGQINNDGKLDALFYFISSPQHLNDDLHMSKNVILQFQVPMVPMDKASSRSEKRRWPCISEFLTERGVEERTNSFCSHVGSVCSRQGRQSSLFTRPDPHLRS